MLTYTLYGIFILSCVVLVISVLLQPGKADAGALFTSSVSSTAFGPRGTQTILAKITIGAAITFMIVALMLTLGVGGQRSLLEGGAQSQQTPTATPAQPAATPQTEGAAAPPATDAAATPAAAPESNASPENK